MLESGITVIVPLVTVISLTVSVTVTVPVPKILARKVAVTPEPSVNVPIADPPDHCRLFSIRLTEFPEASAPLTAKGIVEFCITVVVFGKMVKVGSTWGYVNSHTTNIIN